MWPQPCGAELNESMGCADCELHYRGPNDKNGNLLTVECDGVTVQPATLRRERDRSRKPARWCGVCAHRYLITSKGAVKGENILLCQKKK